MRSSGDGQFFGLVVFLVLAAASAAAIAGSVGHSGI